MPLQASIYAGVKALLTEVTPVGGPASLPIDFPGTIELLNGSGANQANKLALRRNAALASGANEDLDLAAGAVLVNPLTGAAQTFTNVKCIVIEADATNTTTITLGGAAANQFQGPFGAVAHTITVAPGARHVLDAPVAGWAVTPATGDLLRVANSAGAAGGYSLTIIGT